MCLTVIRGSLIGPADTFYRQAHGLLTESIGCRNYESRPKSVHHMMQHGATLFLPHYLCLT